MAFTLASTVTLNNGVQMPVFGLGAYHLAETEAGTMAVVQEAVSLGYRLIDTATAYGNEEAIGRGLRESGVPRRELFVTTKVWTDEQGEEETPRALQRSLTRLGLSYVDLYLIHWPAVGRWQSAWRAMLALLETGQCRAIGVSNFGIPHLDALRQISTLLPAVNQIECTPFRHAPDLLAYCRDHGIQVEAYSPLTRGAKFGHPVLLKIAQAHGKTPAQVLIRWGLDHRIVEIPKASSSAHLRENTEVFDFGLTAGEMQALDGLHEGFSINNPEWTAQFAE